MLCSDVKFRKTTLVSSTDSDKQNMTPLVRKRHNVVDKETNISVLPSSAVIRTQENEINSGTGNQIENNQSHLRDNKEQFKSENEVCQQSDIHVDKETSSFIQSNSIAISVDEKEISSSTSHHMEYAKNHVQDNEHQLQSENEIQQELNCQEESIEDEIGITSPYEQEIEI